ncbi:MAG: hypothetical protein KIT27_01960 [Legionellales bacterium]|nr:hypothetical protein [Legionellales bacterium]
MNIKHWIAIIGLIFCTQVYCTPLAGRYILEKSHCAGFDFKSSQVVYWYNETQCQAPERLRIKWLSANLFALIEDKPASTNHPCPPRVYIEKILTLNSHHLVLKEFWTGWNNLPDEINVYTKRSE